MEEEKEVLLPEFFPLVDRKKVCKKVADTFFDCFTKEGIFLLVY